MTSGGEGRPALYQQGPWRPKVRKGCRVQVESTNEDLLQHTVGQIGEVVGLNGSTCIVRFPDGDEWFYGEEDLVAMD